MGNIGKFGRLSAGTIVAVSCLMAACGGTQAVSKATAKDTGRSATLSGTTEGDEGVAGHCSGADGTHEVTEYDTSGDAVPDVRKVFLRVGDGTLARLVLICREVDLNADGVKDAVRYYMDDGRPLREEADRDLNGKMDEVTYYQDGQILRQEFDSVGKGNVDLKVFFEGGKPLRAERDLSGHSTADKWVPDRWEYFEDGRMVRMGTDLDGDGKVDRWDRDMILRNRPSTSSGAADASS